MNRIHRIYLLFLYAFSCSTLAALFSNRIQDNTSPLLHLLDDAYHDRSFHEVLQRRGRRRQAPFSLTSDGSQLSSLGHAVEIWDGSIFSPYIVPAALGNPPQPFRLLIDLAWDTLFVPSAECTGDCEDSNGNLHFFSNHSSTYSQFYDQAWTVYGTDRFTGRLASDTFRIAGLEVHDQYFINVDRANPLGFLSFYYGYDGVLGLAPRFDHPIPLTTERTLAPSPWSMMVNQSVLDANMFALELPAGVQDIFSSDRIGEITFGGTSDKYASSTFSRLPLSNYSDEAWVISAESLTWENSTHPIHEDFVNVTLAGFDTTAWAIFLPGDWPQKIYASVEHKCQAINCWVDCDARSNMPNITFGLGGQKFTLTAFDYTVEMSGGDELRYCFFDLYPSKGHYPVDAIVLGKPFMENFYSVFDLDEREVRLTRRIE